MMRAIILGAGPILCLGPPESLVLPACTANSGQAVDVFARYAVLETGERGAGRPIIVFVQRVIQIRPVARVVNRADRPGNQAHLQVNATQQKSMS